ncbi:MAG: dTMP kinase [Leucobacter sp.]|nr:dTMP kinase [Leucobacter sp.]
MSESAEPSLAAQASSTAEAARSVAGGLFVTFEGGDGAGKSTQADLLATWLEAQGYEVVRTRDPGGTPLGSAVRALLLHGDHVDQRAEALLYAADRAQNLAEVVRPALARGAVVVQDRYIDSSLAYQGAGRPLPSSEIRELNEWATEGLWPQLTVLLDVSPDLAARRRASAGQQADRLEREAAEFHHRVREGFLALAAAEPDRFLVLDAAQEVKELHTQILSRIATYLAA